MKATINIDGVLCIEPEIELEEYALNKYCESNFDIKGNLQSGAILIKGLPEEATHVDED